MRRLLFPLFALVATTAGAAEIPVTDAHRQALSVTIYGNGLAHVRDHRRIDLPGGESALALAAVSDRMDPTTALLLGPPTVSLVEQNFERDIVTRQTLLERSIGREVLVVRRHPTTGADVTERAVVLAVDGGLVLRIGERIETDPPGRLVFEAIPDDLRLEPTLVAVIRAEAGPTPLVLSYLTEGLTWRADYAGRLNGDGTAMDLLARATLENGTAMRFAEAGLQLVAGEVRRQARPAPGVVLRSQGVAPMAMVEAADTVSREAMGDVHLYTVPRPVTLNPRQMKQIPLRHGTAIPVRRSYLSHSGRGVGPWSQQVTDTHPRVRVRFDNRREDGLGEPLPAGIFRVYQPDAAGQQQFAGETRIPHTPEDGTVTLLLGEAFDITVKRVQTDYGIQGRPPRTYESAHRVEIRNRKDQAADVVVAERIQGDWTILEESHSHTRVAADRAEWTVHAPAGGDVALTFRVGGVLRR